MHSTRTLASRQPIAGVPRAAKLLFRLLQRLQHGMITVHGPGGFSQTFGQPGTSALHVRVMLDDWQVVGRCLKSGDIGFAETYMDGRWRADHLPDLIELFARNRAAMEPAVYGAWLGRLFYRLRRLVQANSRRGAKRNIAAHYDLGNGFYRLWLDPSMTYSSALFEGDSSRGLEDAQAAKYRRVLARLAPRAGQRILEIGCGWGGFAELAAREHGVHVTGLTLSHEQLVFARERIARAGLASQAEFLLTDYRDLTQAFDHVVSIEMFEAVGEAYWDGYFDCVRRCLKPGGRALVQTITIDDALFDRYRAGTDFIQQYIFPGGMLPSPQAFGRHAHKAGLAVGDTFRFGRDYAETLKRWRADFMAALPAVRALGFDERFVRLWEFYLAYSEGAFNAGSTDVIQFELTCLADAK